MNNENKNSDAGEQAKQEERPVPNRTVEGLRHSSALHSLLSYIPFIVIFVFLVFFLYLHHDMNLSAKAELTAAKLMPSYNALPRELHLVQVVYTVEGEKRTMVMNESTGGKFKKIDKTYCFEDENGIIKITPDQIYRIKGSFVWRFFKSGLFKGEKNTSFKLNHWQEGVTTLNDVPTSALNRMYFDPTNPTPFYFLIALFVVSLLITTVIKRLLRRGEKVACHI